MMDDKNKKSNNTLIPLPSGSLLLNNSPERRKRKFNELANVVNKPSAAFERLRDFLPSMAASNASMDSKLLAEPNSFIAEDVEKVDGPVIEMNVAMLPMDFDSESCSESSDSSSDDDDDDDVDSDIKDSNNVLDSTQDTNFISSADISTSDEHLKIDLKLSNNKKGNKKLIESVDTQNSKR